ncbi:MAG: hypothetical protein P8010_11320 [Desulfosarcinaceae bacterium]|jgi:hypothetical protein
MALPATHVRYALMQMPSGIDIHQKAYIAGTLYPDSRMLTGVSRELTHGEGCLADGFANTPFRLGWQLHLRCDLLQAEIHTRLWPAAADLPEPRRWIAMSAAKMVQDEADRLAGPLLEHLEALSPSAPPFGESFDRIVRFYRMIHGVYACTEIAPHERFARLWAGVGLDAGLIDRLLKAYEELLADEDLAQRIAASLSLFPVGEGARTPFE